MFVCGPTVYDYIHIGNARTFVFFDVVAKYLRFRGFDAQYIQNITDIDDKIILRAQKENQDPLTIAGKFTEAFLKDMESLGVTAVSQYAAATEHIDQVIKQIKTLIDKGHAYLIEGDGWYFDLSTFPEYGKLSKRTTEMADDAVSRIDENQNKRNRGDFALWKLSKPGEPSWDSELGKGRPGWHIEDTAITEHYFGPQYDLHGGGQDLIFPHHEAEIAQQEAASGLKPFVRYWMHVAFIVNKQAKMSKSLGNFTSAHDLLESYPKEVLRFFLLSAHYRTPLDFTDQNLIQSEAAISRIGEFVERIKIIANQEESTSSDFTEAFKKDFTSALDDDFNIPNALAALFDLIRQSHTAADEQKLSSTDAQEIQNALGEVNAILGIIPAQATAIPEEIKKSVQEREAMRQNKDFSSADALRQKISDQGYQIEDTTYGPLLKKKKTS